MLTRNIECEIYAHLCSGLKSSIPKGRLFHIFTTLSAKNCFPTFKRLQLTNNLYGWPLVCKTGLNQKKIATVHFNNLEYYFIAHDKIKVKLLKLQGRQLQLGQTLLVSEIPATAGRRLLNRFCTYSMSYLLEGDHTTKLYLTTGLTQTTNARTDVSTSRDTNTRIIARIVDKQTL